MPTGMYPRKPRAWSLDRFLALVEPDLNSGCWLWSGSQNGAGYGCVRYRGKGILAHRLSWTLHNGPIPESGGYHGTCVLHRCDVRACCNPAHLFIGTQGENAADMAAKGRSTARLTPEQRFEICEQRGAVSQVELARRFGVSQPHISRVQLDEGRST